MARADRRHAARLSAVRREGERVMPLELFFDLVFVLAVTQCTSLMSADPTWEGLGKGLLVLGVLWWSWVGYAWLTSVVDPEEGAVRLLMFATMAAFLVVSLSVPDAFGDSALVFAVGYGIVRASHIGLFLLPSREDVTFRHSVLGLAGGTATGVGLLVVGAFFEGGAQVALWGVALLLDISEPFFFGAEGWTLVPGHFVERHGLVVIIAFGESIVAIGVGAEAGVTAGVIAAAVAGIAGAAAMWWAYFDVLAYTAARRLAETPPGREQNEMARDAYSYIHFPMVAGIVLGAVGLKKTIAHVDDPLETVAAVALLGGVALYLLGVVAFRLRTVGSVSIERLLVAGVLLALVPVAVEVPAVATVAGVAVVLWALVVYEALRYRDMRAQARAPLSSGPRRG